MPQSDEPIRVFIGADERQWLAAEVLKFSINEHASRPVEMTNLEGVTIGKAASRTGFSFARFKIPELCGLSGRAIYVDADMLVFRDIAEIWDMKMPDDIQLLYSRQPLGRAQKSQYAVLLMDCGSLRFDIDAMLRDLDAGRASYHDLLYQFSMLPGNNKADGIPMEWNSLEHFVPAKTALIHYTNMPFQPWVYPYNPNGALWYDALRRAIEADAINCEDIAREINMGHVSPALPRWAGMRVEGIKRREFGWISPALRPPDGSGLLNRVKALIRVHILASSWFLWLRGRLDGSRYRIYGRGK